MLRKREDEQLERLTVTRAVGLGQCVTGKVLYAGVVAPTVVDNQTDHFLSVGDTRDAPLAAGDCQTLALYSTHTTMSCHAVMISVMLFLVLVLKDRFQVLVLVSKVPVLVLILEV